MKECPDCHGFGYCCTERHWACETCDGSGLVKAKPGFMGGYSSKPPRTTTMTVNLKDMDSELIKLYYGQDYPMDPKFKPAKTYQDPWDGYTLDKKLELLAASIRAEQRMANRATELEQQAKQARADHRAEQDYRLKLERDVARDLRRREAPNPWAGARP